MTIRQFRAAGDEITGVAVAIRRMSPRHTHTGVLHRHTNGQLFLLHLGGDFDLSCEVFNGSYAWVIPDLLPEEIDNVRAQCRAVWREMPSFHYSFRFDPGAILDRDTANLISQHAPYGLTCSTFVLAVFNSAHVQLIDPTDWPARPEDQRWYEVLFNNMRHIGVDPVHLARIESDVTCIRIRPEEVAGACLEPNLPAQFRQCESNGRYILNALDLRMDASLNRATAAR